MKIDVLTACDGHFSKIQPLLESLAKQSTWPKRVIILLYKKITREEQDLFLYYIQRIIGEEFYSIVTVISHLNSDHIPGKFHGYDRQFLMSHAKAKYSLLIDGDNEFNEEFIEQLVYWQSRISHDIEHPVIVSPTVMFRRTGNIQSQGITGFWRFFPKYLYARMGGENRQEVMMIGANSLFGPTKLFQTLGFDEEFPHCYEDIDFSYRAYLQGYPVVVINTIETYHMETRTSQLGKRFLASPTVAYYRAKNRILFAKKNATLFQKVQYFGLGVWIQTAGFLVAILLWGSGKNRVALWKAVVEGTRDGISL